jgi:hypothetical protein
LELRSAGAAVDTENGPIGAELQQLITVWPQTAGSLSEGLLQQATESVTTAHRRATVSD